MSLEVSDLNDGTILSATKQATDEKGSIQFRITLPSGRELVSEFFNPEKARQARMAWLDHVKQQVALDVQEMQRQKRARTVGGHPFRKEPDLSNTVTPVTPATEPIEFVRSQMLQAGAEVERLTAELGALRVALDEATRRHQQWVTTHTALTGQEKADE